ncbi:hypothetical protein BKA57DRAFT_443901 [Linnemannia elongata]|nr:hypothetical protein BGZ91_003719 [Linnemannia elongata]KAH7028224.1 hypothetical protein BKA57DRAFT_443901 [Linnemannia elongata]KAK5822188.1 hypothetical protein F5H01DRAFT_410516 [Linnemannia elongata]
MENDHAFGDAVIRAELVKYLTPRDMTNLCLTSKQSFDWFVPHLWHTRAFYTNLKHIPGLKRYQQYVKVIKDLAINLAVESRDFWAFPNLQSVQFVQHSTGQYRSNAGFGLYNPPVPVYSQYAFGSSLGGVNAARVDLRLVLLLQSVPLLQDLTITLALDNSDVFQHFLASLQSLTQLRTLKMTCNEYVNPTHIQKVIRACRQCQELDFSFSGVDSFKGSEEKEEYEQAKVDMEGMEDLSVKILKLATTLEDQEAAIMVPLLKKCPLLQELHMFTIKAPETVDLLQEVFMNGACPQLSIFHPGRDAALKDDPLPILLSVMGPDRGVNAVGLAKIMITSAQFKSESALAMTEHLSQSLTEVHFQDHIMNFEVFNELVTGLPFLQFIRARINEISVQTVDINNFDQMCSRDWVCLGLKKLQLGSQLTQGIPTVKGDSWKQSLPKRCMDYIFSQVSKLEQLEEWDFVAGPVDLFILAAGGYLRQLSDLKSLKKLGLGPRTVYRMGAKEAEWVAENWTSLENVDLACDSIPIHIMDISRVKADKLALDTFIHTLRSKRPKISFRKQ